jgi:sulfatase modifying factor 1
LKREFLGIAVLAATMGTYPACSSSSGSGASKATASSSTVSGSGTTSSTSESSTGSVDDGGAGSVEAPSCQAGGPGLTNCGPGGSGTESCCTSLEVEGGTYYRTFTAVADGGATGLADPATVSGFRLDKYDVTVGRFRQYVNYLVDGGSPPADGSGKHAHLNGGRGLVNGATDAGVAYETGWDALSWNPQIANGADAGSIWATNLATISDGATPNSPGPTTWTATSASQEDLPINAVNWYEAYAFCIWDGGFLPSQAEWEAAAVGGNQQRRYPWGSTDPATMGFLYAVYGCNYPGGTVLGGQCVTLANIASVGTATLGVGLWGQLDMAGEVFEWTMDTNAVFVDPCTDCAYLAPTGNRVEAGGQYGGTALLLHRNQSMSYRSASKGLRCARTP